MKAELKIEMHTFNRERALYVIGADRNTTREKEPIING